MSPFVLRFVAVPMGAFVVLAIGTLVLLKREPRTPAGAYLVLGLVVWGGGLLAWYGIEAHIDRQWALNAAATAERNVPRLVDEEAALMNLSWAANAVFNVGRTDKAQEWSERLLALAPGYGGHWAYGNAIHNGHAMLGRIALVRGDRELAKEHLHAAGRTPGSPNLRSFGPNVCLARDLLAVGERDAVLAYFDQCERFWKLGGDELTEWRQAIGEGKTPDFGANLAYW